jgi:hypothetical protein
MRGVNFEIKNDFDRFESLIKTEKEINSTKIDLKQKQNNKNWLTNNTEVYHPNENPLNLTTEKQKFCTKYAIKLQCLEMSKTPFIRFDSDGPAHRNKENSIPLKDQLITTPHFNSFDKNGRPIAYKTPELKKESESEAIVNNIEFGLNHFFNETNIKNSNSPSYVEVGSGDDLRLFEEFDESDPLINVDFII